ncbi:MAG TPA: biotin carboxylase N-terminal domain-containing protein, partial [Acidimicrobiales bacterium]|nr:biotin carboxylase N-terminal domain-containing protein [Acidimicrobiales bacterium]
GAGAGDRRLRGGAALMRRLLVANRGEIARRVLRAAASLGIETVAVFADDDRTSPHVAEADRAVLLGAGPVAGTYLDLEKVLAAARFTGADALHPGYGFLSEDPRLAEGCAAAGIVWVGPPPAAMAAMAHKARAKATVSSAGVPVLPGAVVDGDDPGRLAGLGEEVGYPLLVKASAGGGGRGMRLVEGPSTLAEEVAAARREAGASFGSDEVFLERYLPSPRHIEVQVVADRHGNVLHLYDRECSIQRRHQKVVEEAPASLVGDAVRQKMWSAAVAAGKAVGYEGVGTVEFVVGGSGDDGEAAYFLEMNTRLQVEHGVTELVTGMDLVALQLAVADGRPLPFTQDEVSVGGHAIEVRLCAERPREHHRPTPGRVLHARWPRGEGIRVDAGVETGSTVTSSYDSLLAKVLAVAEDRETAAARLRAALGGPLELDGVETNRQMLAAVLGEDDFRRGRTATDYLDTHPDVVAATLAPDVRRRHASAAALFLEQARAAASVVPGAPPSWRNVGRARHQDRFVDCDDTLSVAVARPSGRLAVVVEGPGDLAAPLGSAVRAAVSSADDWSGGAVDLEVDGVTTRQRIRRHAATVAVSSAEGQSTFELHEETGAVETGVTAGECRAPLPGSVVRVLVAEGDVVEDGQGLVVLEAMKMEHVLRATANCSVQRVLVSPGEQVDVGDLLVVTEVDG